MYQKIAAKFTNVSFTIILVLCALLPFVFAPAQLAGLGAVKGVILYIAVFLAFSLWLVSQFVEGTLHVPRHRAILALGGLVVLSLISALASKNVTVSLWGRGFVVDSFASVLVLSLFAFLVATFARDQRRLIKLFLAAFVGAVVTLVLQVILYALHGVPF